MNIVDLIALLLTGSVFGAVAIILVWFETVMKEKEAKQ